jgi:Cu(I)/Ag(I) efflux system membrane fusion protein
VKLRVNVANPDGKLKPEMFVRAVVRAKVAQGGRVMAKAMAGKWICPMHPDVVKDTMGSCDICGMDLVTTESLGYVKVDAPKVAPLVIPASAPLITGKRAVVYVQLPKTEAPTYEGREVVLGPRAGDYYLVKEGLAEGEIVVTNGNFKIDSALQIQAKPSMMSPEGSKMTGEHYSH